MYFISNGAVTIKVANRKIKLGSGDFFGEMALMTDQPRNADVIADSYCDLLVLHKKDFQRLMNDNLQLKSVIHDVTLQRTADNTKESTKTTNQS